MKTETILEIAGIAATVLTALYLTTRPPAVAAADQPSTGAGVPGQILPGGIVYGGSVFNIPPLPGSGGNIKINLPQGSAGSGNCCASCGCDPGSLDNAFATSIASSLNTYAEGIQGAEQQYEASVFGSIPAWLTQYIVTADPSGGSSLNG